MTAYKGIILTIVSAIIFGFTPILAKITYGGGSNATNLTFFRAFMALPILFAILKIKKVDLKITKEQFKHLGMVGIFGQALTTVTLYASYDYMEVGMATTIHFIYPAIVVLASVILYKEKMTTFKVISLSLACIGMLFFIEPSGTMSWTGVILSILSGITYAFYIIYIDKSGLKSMDSFKLTFYLSCIVSVSVFIYGLLTNSLSFNLTLEAWSLTFIISILVTVIAVVFLQMGIKLIGSAKASILSLFEPVTSVIFGLLLLNEELTVLKFLGCLFVIASGLMIIKDKAEQKNKVTTVENKEELDKVCVTH